MWNCLCRLTTDKKKLSLGFLVSVPYCLQVVLWPVSSNSYDVFSSQIVQSSRCMKFLRRHWPLIKSSCLLKVWLPFIYLFFMHEYVWKCFRGFKYGFFFPTIEITTKCFTDWMKRSRKRLAAYLCFPVYIERKQNEIIMIIQTSIFLRILQYIHDLSSALNLSLIVFISSQISLKCSFSVYT